MYVAVYLQYVLHSPLRPAQSALGLALGESWEGFPGKVCLGKPAKLAFVENKDAVRKNLCLSPHNFVGPNHRNKSVHQHWALYRVVLSSSKRIQLVPYLCKLRWMSLPGQQVQLPNRSQSKVDQLRQPVSEMHGSIAFSESSEYNAALQFSSRRSICRLYFCAKSHKLGINPWQGPRLHSLLTVFAPLHCTQ